MKNLYKVEIEGTVKYMFGNHTGNIINDLTNADMGYKNTSIEKVCAVNDILNVDAFVRAENEQIEALVKEAIKKIENKSFKK